MVTNLEIGNEIQKHLKYLYFLHTLSVVVVVETMMSLIVFQDHLLEEPEVLLLYCFSEVVVEAYPLPSVKMEVSC